MPAVTAERGSDACGATAARSGCRNVDDRARQTLRVVENVRTMHERGVTDADIE
jgi:hypothetical protein